MCDSQLWWSLHHLGPGVSLKTIKTWTFNVDILLLPSSYSIVHNFVICLDLTFALWNNHICLCSSHFHPGGSWGIKWSCLTPCLVLYVTTLRNSRSSPVALTERYKTRLMRWHVFGRNVARNREWQIGERVDRKEKNRGRYCVQQQQQADRKLSQSPVDVVGSAHSALCQILHLLVLGHSISGHLKTTVY